MEHKEFNEMFVDTILYRSIINGLTRNLIKTSYKVSDYITLKETKNDMLTGHCIDIEIISNINNCLQFKIRFSGYEDFKRIDGE